MAKARTLTITTPTDRTLVMTRVFQAPRRLVFEALTQPPLLKRWLFGPEGWSLAVCEIDLRVGGRYRYVWTHVDGREMGMGGAFREIVRPERIVATELFDEDWTGGEALSTTVLDEASGVTTLTNTMLYASKAARDGVLETPMDEGMEMGYDRLAGILAESE